MNIEEQWKNELPKLISQFPQVRKLILFGSRARGDADDRSDIDIAMRLLTYPYKTGTLF